jgi:hypothetical protein
MPIIKEQRGALVMAGVWNAFKMIAGCAAAAAIWEWAFKVARVLRARIQQQFDFSSLRNCLM